VPFMLAPCPATIINHIPVLLGIFFIGQPNSETL
jgi:hypothetical protein